MKAVRSTCSRSPVTFAAALFVALAGSAVAQEKEKAGADKTAEKKPAAAAAAKAPAQKKEARDAAKPKIVEAEQKKAATEAELKKAVDAARKKAADAKKKAAEAAAKAKVEVRVRKKEPEAAKKSPSVQIVRRQPTGDPNLKPRTWLGIAMREVPGSLREYLDLPEGFGVQVEHVAEGSPAAEAGLEVHDILTGLDDQKIISPEHVALLVRSQKKGDTVELHFIRKGNRQSAKATLGAKALPPFSNAPHHHRGGGGGGDNHHGFGLRFGEPGKEGHFELRMPRDWSEKGEWGEALKKYQGHIKEWLEKNPDLFRHHRNWEPRPAQPVRPGPPKKAPGGADRKEDGKPAVSRLKPIPQLPGKESGKPPAVMVRPGFPLEVVGGAGIVKIDNPKGAVTIVVENGDHKITIKNEDGETVYEGPFEAEKGIKGLPREAREQLDEMKMDDLKLLTPSRSRLELKSDPAPSKPKGKGTLL